MIILTVYRKEFDSLGLLTQEGSCNIMLSNIEQVHPICFCTSGLMRRKLESCFRIQQDLGITIPVPSLATWESRSLSSVVILTNWETVNLVHEGSRLFEIFVAFHAAAAHLVTRLSVALLKDEEIWALVRLTTREWYHRMTEAWKLF